MVNTISTDFTRLYEKIPPRQAGETERDLRAQKRAAIKLFDDMSEEGFAWGKTALIDPLARLYISRVLDQCALKVYNEAAALIQATPEHLANYQALVATPKNCGGFKLDKTILRNASPFEQMVALDQWIDRKAVDWSSGRRTLCLSASNNTDYVPIYIASRVNVTATTMTTMLGVGRDDHKAPTYSDLSLDPEQARTSVFVEPLECLEVVRQPYFAAATILKGNAFKAEVIDHTRRFEVEDSVHDLGTSQFACVELVGQNNKINSPTKEKSAATNLISLVKKYPDETINCHLDYEDLAPQGYNDDGVLDISSLEVLEAAQKMICRNDDTDLTDITTKLFVAMMQPFSSAIVANYYAEKLF